jgi:uncharacterized membrane protein YccF (DUF307 family)
MSSDPYYDEKRKNSSTQTTVVVHNTGPGCVVRGLWFVFLGWWLGQIWIGFTFLAMISIIGIPIAIWMVNRIPQILTLKSADTETIITQSESETFIEIGAKHQVPQINGLIRAAYFIFIGGWLTGIWLELAYIGMLTIILLPLSFWMFDRTPAIMTLKRT